MTHAGADPTETLTPPTPHPTSGRAPAAQTLSREPYERPAVEIAIRAMRHRDVEKISTIEAASHPIDAWHTDAFHEAIADRETYVCRVAVDTSESTVGYAVLSLAADQADLQNLTVRADRRRQGIGHRLLDSVLDEAVSRGAPEVYLEVRRDNAAAIALYVSYGFAEVGRRRSYYAPGVDAVVMRRGVPAHASAPRPPAGVTPG